MKKKTVITTDTIKKSGPGWELEGPPPRITPRPKILKTSDLKRPEDSPVNINQAGGIRTSAIDDRSFITSQASDDEVRALREKIEARQQAPAAPGEPDVVLICDFSGCRRWDSYTPKEAARNLGQACIYCGKNQFRGGGKLRAASEDEAAQFWLAKKHREQIFKLRVKQEGEAEMERRRLGIHLHLDNRQGPSIAADETIKKGRG